MEHTGLPDKDYSFDALFFLNRDIGFITGCRDSIVSVNKGNIFAESYCTGKIFRTNDGGHSWKEFSVGSGTVQQIFKGKSDLYVRLYNASTLATTYFMSKDLGNKWIQYSPPDSIYSIASNNDIEYFEASLSKIVYINNGKDTPLLTKLFSINKDNTVHSVIWQDQYVYKENSTLNRLVLRSLIDIDSVTYVPIHSGLKFLKLDNGNLYLGFKEKNIVSIYKMNSENIISEIGKFDIGANVFFDDFNVFSGSVVLLLSEISGIATKSKLLLKSEEREQEINFSIDYAITPNFYLIDSSNSSRWIFYSLFGRFQILEIGESKPISAVVVSYDQLRRSASTNFIQKISLTHPFHQNKTWQKI